MRYDGNCVGGTCFPQKVDRGHPSIRCPRHAALWNKEHMEAQGWVCISEWGDTPKPATSEWLDMVRAVHAAGADMQQGAVDWDDQKRTARLGVWAPRVVAAVLGTMAGKTSVQELTGALRASKLNQEFGMAVDAAYKLGGREAAHAVILDNMSTILRNAR